MLSSFYLVTYVVSFAHHPHCVATMPLPSSTSLATIEQINDA